MPFLVRATFVLYLIFSYTLPAFAVNVQNYVVLPFKVNGGAGFHYLENAIPSMLSSRLFWEDHTQPMSEKKAKRISSAGELGKICSEMGADYAVWGEVTVIGNDAQVDIFVRGKNGKEWHKGEKTSVKNLNSTLQGLSNSLNSDLFGRSAGGITVASRPVSKNQVNSDFVHNEQTQRQVYLNPQFRYQGNDGTRLRSQSLPFASVAMEIADFDGDGQNEIALLSKDRVYMYRWSDQGLRPLGDYKLPSHLSPMLLRSFDIDRDQRPELIVCTYDADYTEPRSFILTFRKNKLSVVMEKLPYYLNVVRIPPDFMPVLLGQRGDASRIFARGGIHEMMRQGSSLTPTRRVDMPKDANVLNFVWLPGKRNEETEKLIVLNDDEKLRVFGRGGDPIYLSEEKFSGSAIGIAEQTTMAGMGKSNVLIPSKYFVPLRMLAADLEQDGTWEVMVNRPISIAAQYFENYRNFPESEIHTLFWDGVGLSLMWKTRRIKGSVVDFTLSDPNNDGVPDLVAAVNTHPGALGIDHSKTTVVAYPLDLSKMDPKTAPSLE